MNQIQSLLNEVLILQAVLTDAVKIKSVTITMTYQDGEAKAYESSVQMTTVMAYANNRLPQAKAELKAAVAALV
jgi:TPP-dependent trihydroxycyclohexane-1,2-dione (THcHDO) dehydratase